jgi:hypothetical protein
MLEKCVLQKTMYPVKIYVLQQSAKLFLQSLKMGLPYPLTPWRVCPPPPFGAHSLAGEGAEGPNSDAGKDAT